VVICFRNYIATEIYVWFPYKEVKGEGMKGKSGGTL
jgi:hypothetical protein